MYDMDSLSRRQNQARSHSIGGQELHSHGGSLRLRQPMYSKQASYHDQNLLYNDHINNQPHHDTSVQQHQQGPGGIGRVGSPASSIRCGSVAHSPSIRDDQYKSYDRQPRTQLHASLECLNSNYQDYHIQQYHHQRRPSNQNGHQHYATSYVLSPPPANTVINQNAEHDLAAAAMGSPPTQYHSLASSQPPASINYGHQTQSLVNRAMAHVSQSPLKRLGLNGSTSNTGSSLMTHLSSLNHPMRAGHSTISLASSSYLIEDKLQNEIKKLHEELKSEREKNDALSNQLNINSSLMTAFEQSLTTLNTRLRQLTTLNEKKDTEIEALREQLSSINVDGQQISSQNSDVSSVSRNQDYQDTNCDNDSISEQNLRKQIEDLKRQLVEKDRLLTDTRLEALSAAHQLEQLESKLSGEHHSLVNDDDLDEGVMVVNHSPSDSDAVTDSTHFSEINLGKSQQGYESDHPPSRTPTNNSIHERVNDSVGQVNFADSIDRYTLQDEVGIDADHRSRQHAFEDCRSETKSDPVDNQCEGLLQRSDTRDKASRSNLYMNSIINQHDSGRHTTEMLAGRI